MSLNSFYPLSDSITASPGGLWQIGMILKLENHLQAAKNGNRDSESRLVNRLGQLRRHFPTPGSMSGSLTEVANRSVEWLRTTGRKVDLRNEDPALWITQRDGSPRW